MLSPSNPQQEGSSEVYQDGQSTSDHEAQMPKGGSTIKETDASENTHKQK